MNSNVIVSKVVPQDGSYGDTHLGGKGFVSNVVCKPRPAVSHAETLFRPTVLDSLFW